MEYMITANIVLALVNVTTSKGWHTRLGWICAALYGAGWLLARIQLAKIMER